MVQPKPNIFQTHVKYLLVIATEINIVILGIAFKKVTRVDGKFVIIEFAHKIFAF